MASSMSSSQKKKHKKALIRRHGNICQYCGRTVSSHKLTLDHIVPKSKGGRNARWNLALACEECNQKKESMRMMPRYGVFQRNWDDRKRGR